MSERIEPALTEREWILLALWLAGKMPGGKVPGMVIRDLPDAHRVGALAIANAMLLPDDPRKITRHAIAVLRETSSAIGHGNASHFQADWLATFAEALESYLPPV